MKPEDIQGLLDKLGDLNDEELREQREELRKQLDELRGGDLTDEVLGQMDQIADAIVSVNETLKAREDENAERQEKAAKILSKVGDEPAKNEKQEEDEPAEDPKGTPAGDDADDGGSDAGEPAEADQAEGAPKEAVSAGGTPSMSDLNARRPATASPRALERNPSVTIVAAADVPGFSAGTVIDEWEAAGEAFVAKAESLRGARLSQGQRFPVARIKAQYPDERILSPDEAESNTRRIHDVLSPQAITAAGGLCAPVEVHYGLANISRASRPVRDALARFQARRGGIRFITPPTLSDVSGAIGYVTEADDASGYPPADKPIVTITCGTETTVNIAAVTLRLQVGQFSRMTFPEQFQTWYDLALAQHARQAEGRLLSGISDNSTAITTGRVLGVSRELFEVYGRLAAQYRNRHRMGVDATLQVLLPAWTIDAVIADMNLQLPGDGLEVKAITRQQIEGWFRSRNIAVSWYEDERIGGDQIYGDQGTGAGNGWITNLEGYLFHPGAFLFVDGGTLDLGIEIRDTSTIATNDVQAFMETFENVAFTGIESLRIRSEICVSGSSSATVDVPCPGTGS